MFYFYVPRGRLEVQEQLDEQSRILDHSLKDYDKRLIPALKGTYIYIYIYIYFTKLRFFPTANLYMQRFFLI